MNAHPSYFEEVSRERHRTLPVHCDECRWISRESDERVVRRRTMEDLAKAVGILAGLGSLGVKSGTKTRSPIAKSKRERSKGRRS